MSDEAQQSSPVDSAIEAAFHADARNLIAAGSLSVADANKNLTEAGYRPLAAQAAPSAAASPVAPAQPVNPVIEAILHDDARKMVADGKISLEDVNKSLTEAGYKPIEDPSAKKSLSQEKIEFDQMFPRAKPEEFTMPKLIGPDDRYTPEIQKFDQTARAWLSESRLPKEIGNAVARSIGETAVQFLKMNEGEREIFARTERAKLDRLWGADAARKIDLAKQLVHELEAKRPGVFWLLETSGAGNSSFVIAQLAVHAERLLARNG